MQIISEHCLQGGTLAIGGVMPGVRMTFQFSQEDHDTLELLAETQAITRTQVLRRGIRLLKLIDKLSKAGGRLVMEQDGKLVELQLL